MTALLGYWDGETAWLAADGRCCAGDCIVTDSAVKILKSGEWMIALSGATRAKQVLDGADFSHLRTEHAVATHIRELLKADGFETATDQKGAQRVSMGALIASRKGVAFCCAEFAVSSLPPDRFFGLGSGGDFAQGAAHALQARDYIQGGVEAVLRAALSAAAAGNIYCGGVGVIANTDGLWETHQC